MISFLLTLAVQLRPSASSLKHVLRLSGSGALVLGLGLSSAQAQLAPAGAVTAPATATAPTRPATVGIALTQAKVVKSADGKEQLLDAASVKPGDVLEYRAVYTNRSDKAVTGVLATLPVLEDLVYQPGSARLVQAATKNGVSAAEPLMRPVQSKSEPVPYADYRALRWSSGPWAPRRKPWSARATVEVFTPVTVPAIPGVAIGAAGGTQVPSVTALTASAPL